MGCLVDGHGHGVLRGVGLLGGYLFRVVGYSDVVVLHIQVVERLVALERDARLELVRGLVGREALEDGLVEAARRLTTITRRSGSIASRALR